MTKGRKVPPTPEQLRQGQVATLPPADAGWEDAEQRRTLSERLIGCGVVQSTESGLYHTWVSLYGTDITSWGVYRNAAPAEQLLREIGQLLRDWTDDDAAVARLYALLDRATAESDVQGAVLPDDQVREILATIAERVQRHN